MPDADRLTDERVREIAETYLGAAPICLRDSDGENVDITEAEIEALAREVLAARAGDREEREGIAGHVIVWNGVPQNGSFSSNPEAFERTRDGVEGDTFIWPEDSEIVPARLFVDRAAPGGETRKEANDG